MHTGSDIPQVTDGTSLGSALVEMTEKGFGLTTVIDSSGHLIGVFTDGDLRRTLDSGKDIQKTCMRDVISKNFKYIGQNALAVEAAKIMQESNIYVLLVTDENETVNGIVKMHDLLDANVV
jgi:arabinose-5-phosphate isomerase